MTTIIQFDDLYEIFNHMQSENEKAELLIQDWQRELKAGIYVGFMSSINIPIFGELIDAPEYHGSSYLFGRYYSVACVDGELGSNHCSVIMRTYTREEFEWICEQGWNAPQALHSEWNLMNKHAIIQKLQSAWVAASELQQGYLHVVFWGENWGGVQFQFRKEMSGRGYETDWMNIDEAIVWAANQIPASYWPEEVFEFPGVTYPMKTN